MSKKGKKKDLEGTKSGSSPTGPISDQEPIIELEQAPESLLSVQDIQYDPMPNLGDWEPPDHNRAYPPQPDLEVYRQFNVDARTPDTIAIDSPLYLKWSLSFWDDKASDREIRSLLNAVRQRHHFQFNESEAKFTEIRNHYYGLCTR